MRLLLAGRVFVPVWLRHHVDLICEISHRGQGGTWLALGCPPPAAKEEEEDWLNSSETTTVFRWRRVLPLHRAARTHHRPRETPLQAKKKRQNFKD